MSLKPAPTPQNEIINNKVWPTSPSSDSRNEYADNVGTKIFHVDYLKNTFSDFARSNLYKIEFNLGAIPPEGSFLSKDKAIPVEFLVKSLNIPAFEIGKLEIKRMGERLFIPTNQSYGELQLTFLCDDEYLPRKFLHAWTKRFVYDTEENMYKKFSSLSSVDATVRQFDNNYNTVFAVRFNRIWCSSIGEIQLAQDSDAQIVEFPATFVYQNYDVLTPESDEFYR